MHITKKIPPSGPAEADSKRCRGRDLLASRHGDKRLNLGLIKEGRLSCAVVGGSFDPVAHNRAAWDREVESGNEWTRPVGPEVIARARAGDWSVVLIGYQPVPRDWFPANLAGAAVLCLASGGGQQGPVLAAAGAAVTVLDNSPRQLSRDEEVAARENLAVRTVLGDMRDLSAFPDASFDVVFNPVSNVFCPDLAPVWRESFRVLRPGGILMTGFMNPDIFIFDVTALDSRSELIVRHPLPFTTLDLPDDERQRAYEAGPIEYSHSLTEQIGGQFAAGFILTHLTEAPHHADATGRYMPGYIATRAVKP
jgi:SAM-dependent methyltransferase